MSTSAVASLSASWRSSRRQTASKPRPWQSRPSAFSGTPDTSSVGRRESTWHFREPAANSLYTATRRPGRRAETLAPPPAFSRLRITPTLSAPSSGGALGIHAKAASQSPRPSPRPLLRSRGGRRPAYALALESARYGVGTTIVSAAKSHRSDSRSTYETARAALVQPEPAARAARPWPSVKQPTVRIDRGNCARRPW